MADQQANSNFWGTGTELMDMRNSLDPVGARLLIETIGRRIFGDRYDYSTVEFRGLNLPVTLIDTQTGKKIITTPYWHLMTEDGRGNNF